MLNLIVYDKHVIVHGPGNRFALLIQSCFDYSQSLNSFSWATDWPIHAHGTNINTGEALFTSVDILRLYDRLKYFINFCLRRKTHNREF